MAPKVFVITGPSGVGKGTLIGKLRAAVPALKLSVSATTRAPRAGEQDGREYHFLEDREFTELIGAGAFLEHADYSGHRYGTLRSEVDGSIQSGNPVVLEIEVDGARQVRQAMPEAVQVFISPPSPAALRERLEARGTDDAAAIERRLKTADSELEAQSEFAHVVVNDEIERAARELEGIVHQQLSLESLTKQ